MSSRAEFLTSVAAAAAAAPAGKAKRSFIFDRARFEAILAKPARHRQCFGAKRIDGGSVLEAMENSMDAYDGFLDEGPGSLHAVAVLYHGPAIALALSSTVWNEILFPSLKTMPEAIRKDFADARPGKGNPYLTKDALPHAVARGSAFFVCHNAIMGFASMAAGALDEPQSKVHAAIMAGIVPGALAVPAGVMAINACQEARFTYIAT